MHFVPQAYLKGWEAPQPELRGKLWTFRRVVPRETEPEWKPLAVKSAAALMKFYPADLDRWLKDTIEDPAGEVLKRVRGGQEPSPAEWKALSRFALAQDLRTMKSWMGYRARAGDRMRGLMTALKKSFEEDRGYPEGRYEVESDHASLRVEVTASEDGKASVEFNIGLGPTHWIRESREMVDTYGPEVEKHAWQIMRAAEEYEFPATDHPVLRVAVRSEQDVSYEGGWLQSGVDLIMPLSPDLVMFAQVGRPCINARVFSREHTEFIRRHLALQSHRAIFMRSPSKRLGWIAGRRIDPEMFRNEDRLRKEGESGDPFGSGGEPLDL